MCQLGDGFHSAFSERLVAVVQRALRHSGLTLAFSVFP